jgi:hypothetical protein
MDLLPPPVSEEEAEECITYLASRGISATADYWRVDGKRVLAAFRIVNKKSGNRHGNRPNLERVAATRRTCASGLILINNNRVSSV